MVTRIQDEVPERMVHRDQFGITVYGGKNCRNYMVKALNGFETEILFQIGPAEGNKVNGLTNEVLLSVVIDRLSKLNQELPCAENVRALAHLEDALANLDARMARRALTNNQTE